jgi:hypothetical protein
VHHIETTVQASLWPSIVFLPFEPMESTGVKIAEFVLCHVRMSLMIWSCYRLGSAQHTQRSGPVRGGTTCNPTWLVSHLDDGEVQWIMQLFSEGTSMEPLVQ